MRFGGGPHCGAALFSGVVDSTFCDAMKAALLGSTPRCIGTPSPPPQLTISSRLENNDGSGDWLFSPPPRHDARTS